MNMGQKLKEARTRAGLSQEKVSEEIHVSRQTISNWETEKTYPDVVSIVRLSDLYGISLDELLKGDSKMLQHLEKCTNTVKSSRKLSIIGMINLIAIIVVLMFIGDHGSVLLWITMIGEFVLLCAADLSDATWVKRPVQIVSRALMILCILVYLGLIVLFSSVALNAFQTGDAASGIRLIITIALVAISVYVLFIRKFIRRLSKK